ncbi:MAG: quinol:cytochrome C oxidoreductase, partial [Thermogutta sp.]|uniref:quinol:cytochrome C oxidoreductase n=1 Tax=Thermogutta sp. TaxID=1962930 RepID=UPI001991B353
IAITLFIKGLNLYPWATGDFFLHHPELRHKTVYLNIPFFILRAAFCLAVWWWLGRFYLTRSVAQDADGDPRWTRIMEKWSPAAALLFTVTVTLASFDWVMSLAPAWYSTIFPVYIFSGCVVGGLAGLILILLLAQGLGLLSHRVVTVEHYHDLGKLLFGFVIFWGYIAFSQYMLIWYGNIPEESQFYLPRQQGIWLFVSLGLIFGHLLVPLVGMMPRAIKRNAWTLGFFAVWLLVFHWLDLYWLIKPNWHATVTPLSLVGGILGGAGVFGIITAIVLKGLTRYAPIPVRDPRLDEAIHHEVV